MAHRTAGLLAAWLLVAGCGTAPTPAPLPTVVLSGGNAAPTSAPALGGVIASGVVTAGQEARLAFALAGRVETVAVAVGDQVAAGQVLMRMAGSERLAAAVEAARLEGLMAEQALADLQAAAPLTSAQAQLAVAAAQDDLAKAEAEVRRLTAPDVAYLQDQVSRAQTRLTAAQQNATVTNFEIGVRAARDALEAATSTLKELQDLEAQYPGYGQQHGNALEKAQQAYDRAAQDYQTAEFRLQQAQATDATLLADAQRAFDTARANLRAAQAGPDPVKLALAEGRLAVARATLAEAEARAAVLAPAGVDPDQLALANGRAANARAQLAAAQAALADLELRAPLAGTVIALNAGVGEWIIPGQPVALVSDLSQLRVETTDLSERDVPAVTVGQPATVTVRALGQTAAGRVSAIAAIAETLGGDVVYRVTVTLDAQPEGLRAGMSAEVQFSAGP